ncbi:hypothetical protein B0H13DRAFT_466619 [Mycena leptocephala]|nr:hypothetical protein B0H13DRAFT_466619 [Mycena leptocephala]
MRYVSNMSHSKVWAMCSSVYVSVRACGESKCAERSSVCAGGEGGLAGGERDVSPMGQTSGGIRVLAARLIHIHRVAIIRQQRRPPQVKVIHRRAPRARVYPAYSTPYTGDARLSIPLLSLLLLLTPYSLLLPTSYPSAGAASIDVGLDSASAIARASCQCSGLSLSNGESANTDCPSSVRG